MAAIPDLTQLAREHGLRRQVDLPGDLLDRGTLIERFMMDRPARSPGSAEADPLCLSLGLLRIALAQGAVLVEDEVVAYDWSSDSASIGLAGGRTVEARISSWPRATRCPTSSRPISIAGLQAGALQPSRSSQAPSGPSGTHLGKFTPLSLRQNDR